VRNTREDRVKIENTRNGPHLGAYKPPHLMTNQPDPMTFATNHNRCTLQINADPRVMAKLDNLLEEARVQRTVAAGNPQTSEQVIYHLPHENEVMKAEGVLEAADSLMNE